MVVWGYMSAMKSGIEIDRKENVLPTAGEKSFTGLGTRLYSVNFFICVEDVDHEFDYF